MEITATGAIQSVHQSGSRVTIELDTSPVARIHIWDRPWARFLMAGDRVTVHGTWLDQLSSPRALTIRAHHVYLIEDAGGTGIRWRVQGTIDEITLRRPYAMITASFQGARGRKQFECIASDPVASDVLRLADQEVELAGCIVPSAGSWEFTVTAVRAIRTEKEEAHAEPEPAQTLR